MILVDLDELINDLQLAYEQMYLWNWDNILTVLNDQKEVEAIPVEWIEKYTQENRLYQSDDFDIYIQDMIYDWRKENGTDSNRL